MPEVLGDICSLQGGYAFKSRDFSDTGAPVVKIADVTGGGAMSYSAMQCVPETIAAAAHRFETRENDTLISMTGANVGKVTRVWPGDPRALINQRVGRFVPKAPGTYTNDFIHYLVRSQEAYEFFRNAAYGSAQPNISGKLIESLPLPDIGENSAAEIGALLRALDDKIELNRRMSATLEEMAWALYRSWFVDFDPVHARALGQPPAHMDPTTAALFPDSFGPDGLPKGWEWRSLDDIADFLNGAALQKFPPEDGAESLPVIKIAELRSGITSKSGRAGLQVPAKYKISDGDVLFSWSGSLLQKVWTEGPGALNQHLFKVSSKVVPKWFHFFAVDQHMEEFRQVAASKATTMGHIQRHHLKEAMIAMPEDDAIIVAAGEVIGPAFDRAIAADIESQTLAALRDTLLPRLMSGELRIREAEKYVEEVLA